MIKKMRKKIIIFYLSYKILLYFMQTIVFKPIFYSGLRLKFSGECRRRMEKKKGKIDFEVLSRAEPIAFTCSKASRKR